MSRIKIYVSYLLISSIDVFLCSNFQNVEMPDDVKCDISTRCKTITSEVHNAILVAMTKSTIKVDVTQGQNLSVSFLIKIFYIYKSVDVCVCALM